MGHAKPEKGAVENAAKLDIMQGPARKTLRPLERSIILNLVN
jgi:hypothetical protein